MKAFYVRRIFRLFPALYAMLLLLVSYAVFFNSVQEFNSLIKEIISSALYLNNVSWSWGWGDNGILLAHTWSLAVEEQFYLFWPWILMLGLYFNNLKGLITGLIIFILFIFWFKNFTTFSYVFNSLFYESIFIGCLVALLRWQFGFQVKIPDYTALILLLILIAIGVTNIEWYQIIYQAGGRSFVAIITCIIIISLVTYKNGVTTRLLSLSPMIWIGKISYALYLWHVPVFAIFRNHSTLPPSISFILKFVVTFFLAALSWVLIEKRATNFGRVISKQIWAGNKGR